MIIIPTGISLHEHVQLTASDTWTISHSLNSTALAVDALINYNGGVQTAIPLDVIFDDASTVTVKWTSPQSGKARLG